MFSKYVRRIVHYLGDAEIVLTSDPSFMIKAIRDHYSRGGSFVGGDAAIAPDIGDIPYTFPLVRGLYLLHLPPRVISPSAVMHELSHIVVFERTGYTVISAWSVRDPSMETEERLRRFSMVDAAAINPLNDVLADSMGVKLFKEYVEHLEIEDAVSSVIVKKYSLTRDAEEKLVAALHKVLLVGHSFLTRHSIKDPKARELREKFQESESVDAARSLVLYILMEYVKPVLANLGVHVNGTQLVHDPGTGFLTELVLVDID
jgi:hypothetical protein